MKRSAPLRRSPLRAVPRSRDLGPGRDAWKEPMAGICANCGGWFHHLERHHVVEKSWLRRNTIGRLWDMANSLLICGRCHSRHTTATERLPLSVLSACHWEFAVDVMGVERGEDYLRRYYRDDTGTVA